MISSRWTDVSFDEALDLGQHAAAAVVHAASMRLDHFDDGERRVELASAFIDPAAKLFSALSGAGADPGNEVDEVAGAEGGSGHGRHAAQAGVVDLDEFHGVVVNQLARS
jgi:hypothetical protein